MKAGILHQLVCTLDSAHTSTMCLLGGTCQLASQVEDFDAIRQLTVADLQRLLRFPYTARQIPDEKSRAL